MNDDQRPKVCWQVTLEDHVCYAYAPTRSAAKWVAVSSWREAGYGSDGRWPSPLTAKRFPSRDRHVLSECRYTSCFSEDQF